MTDLMGPAASGCACAGCHALRAELAGDSGLLAVYSRRLLVRGWAGRTSLAEAAYVRAHAGWAQAAARSLQTMRETSDGAALRESDDLTDLTATPAAGGGVIGGRHAWRR